MSEINKHMQKENSNLRCNEGKASNNEVFGVKYGFERETVLHMNKDGGVNMNL